MLELVNGPLYQPQPQSQPQPQTQPPSQQVQLDVAHSRENDGVSAAEKNEKCRSTFFKIMAVALPVITTVSSVIALGLTLSSSLNQKAGSVAHFNRPSPAYMDSKYFCPPTNAACIDEQVGYLTQEFSKMIWLAGGLIANIAVEAFTIYHNAYEGSHDAVITGRKLYALNFVGAMTSIFSGGAAGTSYYGWAGFSQMVGGMCFLSALPMLSIDIQRAQDQRA